MIKRGTIHLSFATVSILAVILLTGAWGTLRAEASNPRGNDSQIGEVIHEGNSMPEAIAGFAQPSSALGGRESRDVAIIDESFEDYQPGGPTWPEDWDWFSEDGSSYWLVQTVAPYEGDHNLTCGFNTQIDNWLVTSMLHMPVEGDTFIFYARSNSFETESWDVWINSDGPLPADFQASGTRFGQGFSFFPVYSAQGYAIPEQYRDTDVWISIRCTSEEGPYLCVDNITMPNLGLFEGFEGTPATGFPPDGWSQEVVSGSDPDNRWEGCDGSTTYPPGVTAYEGSNMAEYNAFFTNAGSSARLITPVIDLSDPALTSVDVHFWMYHETSSGADDRVNLQVSTDGTSWTTLLTCHRNNGQTGWSIHQFGYGITVPNSEVYYALTGISEHGASIYIDKFSVIVATDYEMQVLDASAEVGGTVAVEVGGKWTDPIQAYQLGITFDDTKLAFNHLDFGGSVTEWISPTLGPMGDEVSPGHLSFGAVWSPSSKPPAALALIATIVFDVIATEATETTVSPDYLSVFSGEDGFDADPAPFRFGGTVVISEPPTTCGDADGNGIVNISDAVGLIGYIFGGGDAPVPLCSGDSDGNQIVNISDAVYLIGYIFGGGNPPAISCCDAILKGIESDAAAPSMQASGNLPDGDPAFSESSSGKRMSPHDVVCGDVNGSSSVTIPDAESLMWYLFDSEGIEPNPVCVGDANSDLNVNVSDVVYIINWILGGPEIPPTCCD